MGTAIKNPVPDRVKLSCISDIRALYAQDWASECPDVKNCKWRLNPVWHRMLYSCTHMATVGVKGLKRARREKARVDALSFLTVFESLHCSGDLYGSRHTQIALVTLPKAGYTHAIKWRHWMVPYYGAIKLLHFLKQ